MNDVAVAEDLDASLGEQLHDELLTPEHPAYDEARKLYNAMIDKRPALIARCRDAADVIAAVNHARDCGLDLAIRGAVTTEAALEASTTGWLPTCRR